MTRDELNAIKETLRKGNLLKGVDVVEPPKVEKEGYKLHPVVLGDCIAWEFVPDKGKDSGYGSFLAPIPYSDGVYVEEGLFYTDDDNIWECIHSGIPSGFNDPEYFEIL